MDWTRINNDTAGNPRYVVHFLALVKPDDTGDVSELYRIALSRARALHGKKYHNRQFGGGIVFSTYNLDRLENQIQELLK